MFFVKYFVSRFNLTMKKIYLWRDYLANRVFEALDASAKQAESGLAEMETNKSAIR
jgi:hypothetical protein